MKKLKNLTKEQVLRFVPYLIPVGFLLSDLIRCIWGLITQDSNLVYKSIFGAIWFIPIFLITGWWTGDIKKKKDVKK